MLARVRLGAPGAPPALLAHCFLGHAGTWKGLVAALKAPLDALGFDLPGHGRSPMPDAVVDFLAEVGAEVPALLADASPQGAPVLGMGHSFGGALLLSHALRNPGTVRGLVLIEPVFFAAARDLPEFGPWLAGQVRIEAEVEQGRVEDAARAFLAENGDGTPWAAIPAAERDRLTRLIPLVGSTGPGLIADNRGLLAPGLMEGFEVPVLLLAGSRSSPIFRAVCRALAARLPRAEVSIVEGAGHMLPITHAAEVAGRIDRWLAETGCLAP